MSRVIHFDLPAENPERASKFYSEIFGWKFAKWDAGDDYWMIVTGGEDEPGINGGLMRRMDPDHKITNTIGVENLDETVQSVRSQGGNVLVPRMNIPGVGYLACCSDTEGNYFNIVQLDSSATAEEKIGECEPTVSSQG